MIAGDDVKAGWREYELTRVCGHVDTVLVFAADHAAALDYLRGLPCSSCDPASPVRVKEEGGEVHAWQPPPPPHRLEGTY